MTLWNASRLLVLLLPICTALVAQEPETPRLNILIVEGEGAINNIKQRTSGETIVEIQDENHKPVGGAAVAFMLPGDGPGGAFASGGKSVTLLTNESGRAVMPRLTANRLAGKFQIRVNASSQGRTASVSIGQSNAAAGAAGGAAGAGISAKVIAIIAGVAAAGAVGAAVGLKGKPGGGPVQPPPPPSAAISLGSSPNFGPSH